MKDDKENRYSVKARKACFRLQQRVAGNCEPVSVLILRSIADCHRGSDSDAIVKEPGDFLGQANATVGGGIAW